MKYFRLLIAAAACLSLASCDDYLDRKPDDQLDESQVFTRYNKVNQLVTDLYGGAKEANRPMAFVLCTSPLQRLPMSVKVLLWNRE